MRGSPHPGWPEGTSSVGDEDVSEGQNEIISKALPRFGILTIVLSLLNY